MTKKWTDDDIATLRRMKVNDFSRDAMSKALGRSVDAIDHALHRIERGTRRRGYTDLSPAEVEQARELFMWHTTKAVAQKLGIAFDHARQLRRVLGLTGRRGKPSQLDNIGKRQLLRG